MNVPACLHENADEVGEKVIGEKHFTQYKCRDCVAPPFLRKRAPAMV